MTATKLTKHQLKQQYVSCINNLISEGNTKSHRNEKTGHVIGIYIRDCSVLATEKPQPDLIYLCFCRYYDWQKIAVHNRLTTLVGV